MRVAAALLFAMAITGLALASWYAFTAVRGALWERRRRRQGLPALPPEHRLDAGRARPAVSDDGDPSSEEPRTVLGHVYGLRYFFAVPRPWAARLAVRLSNGSHLLERGLHARSAGRLQYRLRGLWGRTWETPRATATCTSWRGRGAVPHSLPCRCGINMYSITDARIGAMLADVDHRTVVALARGWGDRVVVHEDGYRVPEAELVAVFAHPRVLARARPGRAFVGEGWEHVLVTSDVEAFLAKIEQHRRGSSVEIPAAEA